LQNILVDLDGVTRITDFGIAKTHLYDDVTEEGVVKGKLRYMAPEQLRFESIDRRADLFSMGVVAWELLAGRRLYEGDHRTVLRRRIASDPPPRLSSVEPIDRAIDDLVVRALEVYPDRRPATAKELRGLISETFEAQGGLADVEEVGSYVVQQMAVENGPGVLR
jgi:serine/threonine-protein kinase